jgi:hypothetical protein
MYYIVRVGAFCMFPNTFFFRKFSVTVSSDAPNKSNATIQVLEGTQYNCTHLLTQGYMEVKWSG